MNNYFQIDTGNQIDMLVASDKKTTKVCSNYVKPICIFDSNLIF